jgi:2-polyprenyl-3-methyl-5-hydroxy-6-metoxy-1,4-benzoquinol methylase/uncharacterized protein (DUF2062 family)
MLPPIALSTPAPPPEARGPFREQLRRAWARIRGGELTPWRAAFSVALGVFIGVLPIYGFHILVIVALCVPLRLDAAVAYLAANISIPPMAPILTIAAIQLGSRTLHGHFVPLTVDAARALARHPGPLVGSLAVGSIELGALLAITLAPLTFALVSARRRAAAHPKSAIDDAIERTARRYEKVASSRGTYYYVRGKLNGDPSTRAVAALAPLGEVLDLGCGRGQLAVLLAECGASTRVRGCDWDEAKVDVGNRAASGLDVVFERGDVRDANGDGADTVLLVDVLHYFDRATQDAILVNAASRVKPGGRLLVREADTGRGWRSTMTRIEEGFFTAIKFNRGERVLFRDVARELVPLLEARGFRCSIEPCWGGTPFSNVLLVATRSPSLPV